MSTKLVLPRPAERYDARAEAQRNQLIEQAFSRTSGASTPSGATAWGTITGTLADQTDLAAALAGKEATFSKGSLIQGANVTLTGTLAGRLVGAGDVTIAAAAAGATTWGSITGTLASQTDLQSALNAKEAAFSKGALIQGSGITLSGTLTGRLVGAGDVTVAAAGSSDPWTYVVLGTTFATTSAGIQAVTGLSFTPAVSKTYAIEGFFLLTTTLATVGARPGIDAWPSPLGAGSAATVMAPNSATASAVAHLPGGTAGTAASTGLPATGGNGYPSTLDAVMRTTSTTSGAFQIGLSSETGGTSVSMLAGSYIRYREIA